MTDSSSRSPRVILHVDLDAFFAAVEQRDNPELRGKPVIVGRVPLDSSAGAGQKDSLQSRDASSGLAGGLAGIAAPARSVGRGVVAAASYEVRQYGVHSAMPMAEALRRCPHAIVVPHRMERYIEASRQFFAILDDFSPSVEGLSIDEAFVDATGAGRLLGDGPTIARSIKQRVASELALVASVGVAPSKFVAKIASDIDKPDGLCVVEPDRVLAFLHPLPVSRLWGAGKVTQDKLLSLGLRTIGDVARYPENVLRARLGASLGMHLASLARGEDARPVEARGDPVSIGHEETFDSDLDRREDVAIVLIDQADRVAARLRHGELRARVIQLKIRYGDFHTITRRRTLPDATSDGKVIADAALALLAEVEISDHLGKHRKVRLAGVSATQLEPRDAPRQLTLGEGTRVRGERLGDTLDAIHARFGKKAVHRAVLGEPGSGKKAPGKPGKPD